MDWLVEELQSLGIDAVVESGMTFGRVFIYFENTEDMNLYKITSQFSNCFGELILLGLSLSARCKQGTKDLYNYHLDLANIKAEVKPDIITMEEGRRYTTSIIFDKPGDMYKFSDYMDVFRKQEAAEYAKYNC